VDRFPGYSDFGSSAPLGQSFGKLFAGAFSSHIASTLTMLAIDMNEFNNTVDLLAGKGYVHSIEIIEPIGNGLLGFVVTPTQNADQELWYKLLTSLPLSFNFH